MSCPAEPADLAATCVGSAIRNFQEHRIARRIIPKTMTLADRRSAGWPPCIVDAVEWDGPGGQLGRRDEKCLLSNIVGGRRFLAVIGSQLPVSPTRGLTVVDTSARLCFHLADGSRCRERI